MKPVTINGIEFQRYENDHEVQESPPALIMCRRVVEGQPPSKPDTVRGVCQMCNEPVWISATSTAQLTASTVVMCDDCGYTATALLAAIGRTPKLAAWPRKKDDA